MFLNEGKNLKLYALEKLISSRPSQANLQAISITLNKIVKDIKPKDIEKTKKYLLRLKESNENFTRTMGEIYISYSNSISSMLDSSIKSLDNIDKISENSYLTNNNLKGSEYNMYRTYLEDVEDYSDNFDFKGEPYDTKDFSDDDVAYLDHIGDYGENIIEDMDMDDNEVEGDATYNYYGHQDDETDYDDDVMDDVIDMDDDGTNVIEDCIKEDVEDNSSDFNFKKAFDTNDLLDHDYEIDANDYENGFGYTVKSTVDNHDMDLHKALDGQFAEGRDILDFF